MKRTVLITLALAALLGGAGAWLLGPAWMRHRALTAIASPERATRERGWRWLEQIDPPASAPRVACCLDEIDTRLAASGNDAVRHGADVLRRLGFWDWTTRPRDLVLRELELRAYDAQAEVQLGAAEDLADAPLDLDAKRVRAAFEMLIISNAAPVRWTAFDGAAGWHGPERAGHLALLSLRGADLHLRRMRHLALAMTDPASPSLKTPADEAIDVREARLLRNTLADPTDASVVVAEIEARDEPDPPALEYVLRHSRDPRAVRALEDLAKAGSRSARFALHARTPRVDETQARRIVRDVDAAPTTRRVAAWRWPGIPRDLLDDLLALDPREDDGSVYAAALLAERRLGRDAAVERAEAWIRSFDDDEKRAGALLAALLGEPASLLAEAHEREDMPDVRTTQRLALWALGRPTGPDDPREFAFRVLHRSDGDFRPDAALCMLRAGDAGSLDLLTRPPRASRQSVQQRAWLIERFVPSWYERLGRPVGGNPRALRLHFDALRARYLLERRRIRFDHASGTFVLPSPVLTELTENHGVHGEE
ncbi:MAG: hypothetical protein GY715_18745 [Planctomycetes bacterium]|nr:hypothetical protein [Planctomycetota bacterium]